ncbi:hypothetical protein AV530_016913 [Patagioenas fasciata monilis]|uniref:Uncharacterized protein n=1 Tax=Patagioenas fasciata monilis TaxID=372326 RepID=A0A1V4J413_PATFA|nr:hypothetical protein AV530_016913 [Patagioenas fasciata monilis]
MERIHAGAVCEERQPVGNTLEKLMNDCIPWEGSNNGVREEYEEEEAVETTHYGLTAIPIPYPPVLLGVEEVEESGVFTMIP